MPLTWLSTQASPNIEDDDRGNASGFFYIAGGLLEWKPATISSPKGFTRVFLDCIWLILATFQQMAGSDVSLGIDSWP
jgi:hypothetical protein